MNNNELTHWGIKGMRWGVRRYQNEDGSLTSAGRRRRRLDGDDEPTVKKKVVKKSIKDMTDEEIQAKIDRLQLEKRLTDLMKTEVPKEPTKKTSKGKDFVMDVVEKSGKNVLTQLTTYAMGTAINKVFANVYDDKSIINPKKGQKDK